MTAQDINKMNEIIINDTVYVPKEEKETKKAVKKTDFERVSRGEIYYCVSDSVVEDIFKSI